MDGPRPESTDPEVVGAPRTNHPEARGTEPRAHEDRQATAIAPLHVRAEPWPRERTAREIAPERLAIALVGRKGHADRLAAHHSTRRNGIPCGKSAVRSPRMGGVSVSSRSN